MKAAEAAFKDSVDVWEGGTDTEFGSAAWCAASRIVADLKPARTAVGFDIAAMQQILQRQWWNAVTA